jgi:hypothetical protein
VDSRTHGYYARAHEADGPIRARANGQSEISPSGFRRNGTHRSWSCPLLLAPTEPRVLS